MIEIQLKEYAPVISDEQTGQEIYSTIKNALSQDVIIMNTAIIRGQPEYVFMVFISVFVIIVNLSKLLFR